MRVLKQIGICLVLGGVVVSLGQACGQMETQNKSSTSTSSGIGGSGSGGGGGQVDLSICLTVPTLPICQGVNIPGGSGSGSGLANSFGYADPVTPIGSVNGEAKDPANPNATVTVFFFVGGPSGSGQAAGSTVANLPGLGNTGGAHRFSHTLPAQFRNGVAQTVYAYAFINGTYQLIGNGQQTYAAYTPTAAGQTFYTQNLQTQFQSRCASCHSVSYEAQYANLISPTKYRGGTSSTNALVVKASGQGHGGGSHCGGVNAGLCAQIQQWWALEFP